MTRPGRSLVLTLCCFALATAGCARRWDRVFVAPTGSFRAPTGSATAYKSGPRDRLDGPKWEILIASDALCESALAVCPQYVASRIDYQQREVSLDQIKREWPTVGIVVESDRPALLSGLSGRELRARAKSGVVVVGRYALKGPYLYQAMVVTPAGLPETSADEFFDGFELGSGAGKKF